MWTTILSIVSKLTDLAVGYLSRLAETPSEPGPIDAAAQRAGTQAGASAYSAGKNPKH